MASDVLPYFEARANTGQPTKLTAVTMNYSVQANLWVTVGHRADKADLQTLAESNKIVVNYAVNKYFGHQMSEEVEDESLRQFGHLP
jgi:hypothetical protein